jgi:hypothetical protein
MYKAYDFGILSPVEIESNETINANAVLTLFDGNEWLVTCQHDLNSRKRKIMASYAERKEDGSPGYFLQTNNRPEKHIWETISTVVEKELATYLRKLAKSKTACH